MATVSAPSSAITRAALVTQASIPVSSQILGVPQTVTRGGRVRCSSEKKPHRSDAQGMAASTLLAAASSVSMPSPAALALVDERMSTEGTGLTLGISNTLLGWILLGVFGLIWSLYFVYASSIDEDDDSGLSL